MQILREFVYFAVEICHRGTLPSATPSFPVGENFENRQKHQRHRSSWVEQADFGKLKLNNRNHSGNSQHLSVKCDQFETQSIFFRPSHFRYGHCLGHRSSEDQTTTL